MGDHEIEELGVEVGVGDVVHLVDLGAVIHMDVVVAGVGRKSFCYVLIRLLNDLRLGSLPGLGAGEGGRLDIGLVYGGGRGGQAGVGVGGFYLKFIIDDFGVS